MRQIRLKKQESKDEVMKQLKTTFQHITGMWPKTTKFEDEAERLGVSDKAW